MINGCRPASRGQPDNFSITVAIGALKADVGGHDAILNLDESDSWLISDFSVVKK